MSQEKKEKGNVLAKLRDATEDFYTPRAMNQGKKAKRRAEKDWKKAFNRFDKALRYAQQAGGEIPGNTSEDRVAIMNHAKEVGMRNPPKTFRPRRGSKSL